MLENLKFNKETDKYICPYCGKEYAKNGIGHHIWRKHTEEGQKFDPNKGYKTKNRKAWNKGLTKETDERVRKSWETLKEKFKNNIIEPSFLGRKHSEETKKKISDSRKNFLLNHPEKVPYKLNHSSKQSYPETYFEDFLINHNIDYEKEKCACGYWLDFCFGGKYYIEIDGEQHYLPKSIERDKIRTEKLAENGFVLLQRVRWKLFKKLDKSSKEEYLQKLESCIKQHNDEYIEYNIKKKEKSILKRKKDDGSLKREHDIEVLQKILNCGVDLMKHGYVDKISKATGLTKRKVSKTLKKFKIKTCIRHKKGNSIKVSAIDFDSIYSCSIQDCPAIQFKN